MSVPSVAPHEPTFESELAQVERALGTMRALPEVPKPCARLRPKDILPVVHKARAVLKSCSDAPDVELLTLATTLGKTASTAVPDEMRLILWMVLRRALRMLRRPKGEPRPTRRAMLALGDLWNVVAPADDLLVRRTRHGRSRGKARVAPQLAGWTALTQPSVEIPGMEVFHLARVAGFPIPPEEALTS